MGGPWSGSYYDWNIYSSMTLRQNFIRKIGCMCHSDGLIFTSVGILFLMDTSHNKVIYILGAPIGITLMVLFLFL